MRRLSVKILFIACCGMVAQPSPAAAATCGEILSGKIHAVRTWMNDQWFQLRNPGAPDRGTLRQLREDSDDLHLESRNMLVAFSYFATNATMTADQKDEMSEDFLVSHYRENGGKLHWKPSDSKPQTVRDAIARIILETDFEFLSGYLSQRLQHLELRALSAQEPELEILKRRIDLIRIAFEDYPPRGPHKK